MMNIRDYIFIKKAKSSNKIKILELLGFEPNSEIVQSPELIKNINIEVLENENENIEVNIENSTKINESTDFHKYITSEKSSDNTAIEAIDGIKKFPLWMWRNSIISELIESLPLKEIYQIL